MSSMCLEPTLNFTLPQDIVQRLSHSPTRVQVFCDLDGPLIDVSHRYYRTYRLALAAIQSAAQQDGHLQSLQPLSSKQFWQMKQERVPDAEIAHCSGLHPKQVEPFLAHVQEIVNQPFLLQEDCLQPGVLQSLQLLRQQGIQVSVVTLRWQLQAMQLLRDYQVDHFFSEIRGMDDPLAAYQNYAACKQQLLTDLMTQTGVDPQQQDCWMIGDTEADVLAGQALGLSTIAVTCGMRNDRYLQQLNPTSIQPNLSIAIGYLLDRVAVSSK